MSRGKIKVLKKLVNMQECLQKKEIMMNFLQKFLPCGLEKM